MPHSHRNDRRAHGTNETFIETKTDGLWSTSHILRNKQNRKRGNDDGTSVGRSQGVLLETAMQKGEGEEPDAKRARTSDKASSIAEATAIAAVKGVCGVELKLGTRLEVRWSVLSDEEEQNTTLGDDSANASRDINATMTSEGGGKAQDGDDKAVVVSAAPGGLGSAPEDESEEEEEDDFVWWGCTLASLESQTGNHGPVWRLKYDEMTVRKI